MINTCAYRTNPFFTKQQLYEKIDSIRKKFGITYNDYPINVYTALDKVANYIDYQTSTFFTEGFCGLLFRNSKKAHIVINKSITSEEQSFATAHELVHFFCHDSKQKFMCKPFDKKSNDAFEWQANEGAAEFLLPYKLFIPDYIQSLAYYKNQDTTIAAMANAYNLSATVIDYRLHNLQYELRQYNSGVPLEKIQVLSQAKYQKLKESASV